MGGNFNPYWRQGDPGVIQTADDAWNIIGRLPIGQYLMIVKRSRPTEITQGRMVARDRNLGVVVLQSDNYPDTANVIALSDVDKVDASRTGSGALGPVQEGDWVQDGQGNWYKKQLGPDAPHY